MDAVHRLNGSGRIFRLKSNLLRYSRNPLERVSLEQRANSLAPESRRLIKMIEGILFLVTTHLPNGSAPKMDGA